MTDWQFRIEYARPNQIGEGWFVYGTAPGQPEMSWGPFETKANAEDCCVWLIARHLSLIP